MFDINLIRNQLEKTKIKLKNKNCDIELLDQTAKNDKALRLLMTKQQQFNNQKNILSNEISNLMKQDKNNPKIQEYKNEVIKIKNELEKIDNDVLMLANEIKKELYLLPNICDDDVPVGINEDFNKEIKKYGEPTKFNFEPLSHWEIAKNKQLYLIDESTKLTGSRFITYYKDGARLYRALQQFTLNENINAGFNEVFPQVIINNESLYSSGQLPKFEEDLFKLSNTNYYLSPTAEVQLVNIYRNKIIEKKDLPINLTANTACFRSEAGSAGKDTKGVIRLHQFHKSELVSICLPEQSDQIHEKITKQAESILEKLELPYRRVLLCTGDTGFSSAKTYDLEVWLPSYQTYKEISSCSNCRDFQARRAKIRFKDGNKNELVHTLNGSSLAIDRLWCAIVENYQEKDGSIKIPKLLIPYMNGITKI